MHSQAVVFTSDYLFQQGESFCINRYPENTRNDCAYHTHECIEFCFVAAGHGVHRVNGREYNVSKGDFFIINTDMAHVFFRERPEDTLITYNIVFKPDFLDISLINPRDFNNVYLSYPFINHSPDSLPGQDIRLSPRDQRDFETLIRDMYHEFTLRQFGYMSILRACMVELIVKIMRCIHIKPAPSRAQIQKSSIANEVIYYLRQNYAKPLSLDAIASHAYISKSYLCRLFKDTTGTTISEYVQTFRIEEACKLLGKTDCKITDIASKVGFRDYKFFNAVFKKRKGVTPRVYRRCCIRSV